MQVRSDPHRLGLQRHAITLGHRFLDRPASAMMSAAVAPPRFTSTSAWRSCTPAAPRLRPFQPHWSINQPAASL